jgi:GTPase SAR1 family protein
MSQLDLFQTATQPEAPKKGPAMSYKQSSYLFTFTRRKFEALNPKPSVGQASKLLANLFAWNKARDREAEAFANTIEADIRKSFYPDFDKSELRHLPKKGKRGGKKPAPKADKPAPKADKPAPKKPAPKKPTPQKTVKLPKPEAKESPNYFEQIKFKIAAGIDNIWLTGPAGCGKTTMCRMAGDELNLPVTVLSCGAGTAPAEITGFKYPEPRHSELTAALSKAGIIVLDEFTALPDDVAQSANAMLANGRMLTSMGEVERHPQCFIICTSNTTGDGADRQYTANNQLDAATVDRFVGGFIRVDYCEKYESQFDSEVVRVVQKLREVIKTNQLRRIVSTRAIQAGEKLKKAGDPNWGLELVTNWTEEEKALIK